MTGGEFIWDMSTCTAWDHDPMPSALRQAISRRVDQAIAEAFQRLSTSSRSPQAWALTLARIESELASVLGPRTIDRGIDSETSSDEAWEAGVLAMIDDVKRRRARWVR